MHEYILAHHVWPPCEVYAPSPSRQKQTLDRDVSVLAAGSIDSAQRIAKLCASDLWDWHGHYQRHG